jgi:hypothetical protein
MNALFGAYFCPKWNRASVVWRYHNRWFAVVPGEIPEGWSHARIVDYCSGKCGNLASCQQTSVETCSVLTQTCTTTAPVPYQLDTAEAATQTQHTGNPKDTGIQNTLLDLQQQVAAAKLKTAKKTVECCMIRRKLKAKESSVSVAVQTDQAVIGVISDRGTQTEQFFGTKAVTIGLDVTPVLFSTAALEMEIPAALSEAAAALDQHYQ